MTTAIFCSIVVAAFFVGRKVGTKNGLDFADKILPDILREARMDAAEKAFVLGMAQERANASGDSNLSKRAREHAAKALIEIVKQS